MWAVGRLEGRHLSNCFTNSSVWAGTALGELDGVVPLWIEETPELGERGKQRGR